MGLVVNFSDFENKTGTSLSASDYLVGYTTDFDGNRQELKITVADLITFLESNSGNDLYTILYSNSASWNSVYNSVNSNSASWDSVYSSFNSNSSRYTTLDYLSTNNVLLSAVTVAGNVSITNGLTANTIFTTGSGIVIIDRGNFRRNTDPTIIIGANSDQHLRFRAGGETNSEIRMTILSSGEVGIGTSIAQTRSPVISAIANGNFQNITGLTPNAVPSWYDGIPTGWTSAVGSPTFTIYNGGGDFIANPSQLATGSGSSSLRQNLGTLQAMSDIDVTFDYAGVGIAPWSSGTLNVAIYDGSFNVLATNTYTTAGTYTLNAEVVPAGTTIIVGFWSTLNAPGLNNVTVTQTDKNNLTIAGSISASGNLSVKNINSAKLDLIRSPANDNNNPALRIGEIDYNTGNNGFSGFRVAYNEANNNLRINSNFGDTETRSLTVDRLGGVDVLSDRLTVAGNISATGKVYTDKGNSDQWNSNYTSFNTQSAANASVYTSFNTQSAANASVYTTTNNNSASWSRWSSVSGNYAQVTNYVKLSGDDMTGLLTNSVGISSFSLSARFIDIVHLPANDGTNPVLRIGEYDTASGNVGFSGMFMSYNEISNIFGISAQFAPGAGLPAISIDRNANVGINTNTPSEKLTVSGNISANGNLTVAGNVFGGTNINLLTSTTYTIQLSDNGGTIASSNSTAGLTAVPSTGITYPAGFQTSILQLSTARVALSSNSVGLSINQANGYIRTTKQYSAATLLYTGTLGGWVLFGDVGA